MPYYNLRRTRCKDGVTRVYHARVFATTPEGAIYRGKHSKRVTWVLHDRRGGGAFRDDIEVVPIS